MEYKSIYENFENIIKTVQSEIPDADVSDIPIGPSLIEDNNIQVCLMPEVTEQYSKMLKLINDDSTAKEYPFILLGNYKTVEDDQLVVFEKLVYGYRSGQQIEDTVVNFDSEILTSAANMEGYGIISIGHTHPKLKQEIIKDMVAENLSDNLKNDNGIRSAGLNLSVQDFVQYESLREQINGKEVFQTILMYNGELNIFGNKEGKYYKFLDVIGLTDTDYMEIPVVKFGSTNLVK